jgi:hypothetical protein
LSGGGNLSADLSLAVIANSTNQKVTIQNNGVSVGSEPAINFIPGNNVTITTFNDTTNSVANVTLSIPAINVTTTNVTATTSSNATFATSSLPLVPAGYFSVDLNGTVVKVPYYAV